MDLVQTSTIGQLAAAAVDYQAQRSVHLVDVAGAAGNSGGPIFGEDGGLLGFVSRRTENQRRDDNGEATQSADNEESQGSEEPAIVVRIETSPFLVVERSDHFDGNFQPATGNWLTVELESR